MEIQNAPNMSSSVIDGAGDYEIFSNNFWGKEEAGYEVLTSRLRQAKQTCEDVRNMFHERALIEEEYAKRLMRISKIPIGKDESGTLRNALEVCRQELEATAKEHITLSQKIRTELDQEITHFIARQKETRKLQQAIAEKSLRNKKEHAILVQKAKEKYESECIKIQGLLAGKNSIMGKDLEKLNLKIEKAQMSAKTADQEYMKLVKDAQDITQKWNYDWRTACDKFQDLEEERIDSLKTFLWTYANLISTVCVADDESCERIRVSLEQCNVEKDIQIFIKESTTGPEMPEPPIYVNFYAGPKEDEVRYKVASFDRVPAYIDGNTTTALDPLSLNEYHLAQNINPNGNGYHTRNGSEDYNSMNIERAQLYANTTLNTTNNNYNIKNGEEVIEQVEEDPVDPRAKQMLSIGDNVFEVETDGKPEEKDEIAQALANMQLADGNNNIAITSTANSTVSSNIDLLKFHSTGGSISGGGNNPINANGGGLNRRPLPVNFVTDKPQPPPPSDQTIIQQQQQQINNIPHHQHNNSQTRMQFNPYQLNGNNSPTTPSTIANNNGININGPGDLRRQSSDSNNNGPISSQQQQISQNMSMRPSSQPQSNRNSQQQQGPGDIRRLSNTNSSSPTLTQVPQQGGYQQQQIQGQMISQDQIPTQGNNNNNSSNLNRSDTLRTTSTNSSNNSLGIQLDALGRVKQDELAESFIINGGRLPPESARFQMNSQSIPQGVQQQISSQGQISPQGQQVYQHNNFNLPINQSSFRGQPQQVVRQQQLIPQQVQQQVQQQQLNRSNTLNSNSTLTSAFHHQQQGNPRTTLQGSVSVQQQQQPLVGGQLSGQPQHQLNFQDQNFYNGPIMAQYQRPPVGGGANVQGFQQIQQAPQQHHLHRQLPQFGLQQSLQPMARGIQLQYGHQPLLQRSIIPIDNRQRTEDGKPIEFYVKALYDYQKTIPEEISFTAGDVIAVLNTHSDGWWEGEILDETRRNRGLFPSNYTEILR